MNEEIWVRAKAIVVYGNTVIRVAGDKEGKVITTKGAIEHLITQAQEILDILQSSEGTASKRA